MRQSIIVVVLLAFFRLEAALGADKKIVLPPEAGGNYRPGILTDGTRYISGRGGEDAAGKVPSDFDAEAKQCPDNINAVLKKAGMTRADVVSVQVYLTDAGKFKRMNVVYANLFKRSAAHAN